MADLSSLVVRLSADVANLQSDLGKAVGVTRGAADQMTGAFQKAGGIVKEFAAGLAAAFTIDKIVEVGKAAIDLGDNLNKMSQKVGISVENLSALRNAAQLSDVGFEELGSSTAKFARTMSEAAAGSKQQEAAFRAIGVSVKDANGNLRGTSDVLQDVATKFSGYEDSAAKTALAQQFFGKTGADLIPLLNSLGNDGFEKVTQAARDYNQVIGAEQAAQSEAFNDNLTRLSMAASGFANAVVKEVLPGLVRYSSDMAEASKTNDGYAASAGVVSTAIKGVVLGFTAAIETVKGLVTVVLGLGDVLGAVGDVFNGFAKAVGNDLTAIGEAMRGNFSAAREALNSAGNNLSEGWEKASVRVRSAWSAVQSGIGDSVANTKKAYNDLFGEFSNVVDGADTTAGAVKKLNAPIVQTTESTKAAARANKEWSDSLREAGKALDKIKSLADGYSGDIDDIKARMSGADSAQIAYNKALRDIQDNYNKLLELGPPTADAVAAVGDATQKAAERMDLSRAEEAQKESFEAMNKQIEENQRRWEGWADTIASNIMKGGNFMKNLLQSVKQIVAQIIQEWLKTRIVGLFMGGGGGGGSLGTLVQAGLGAVSTGSGGSAASSAVDFTSTMSGSNFSIMSPSSWISAGKKLWEGFTSTQGVGSASSIFGTYMAPGSQYATVGNLNMANAYGSGELSGAPMGGGYTPSTFGYLAAGAAGVYAGYNRWQGSNKDFGGALGAAAYGIGTYGAALGVGAAATTGSLAVGLGAIPVVGWIALAAMAVDYLSGGKLFGTKGKLDHSNLSLEVGSEGFNLAQSYTLKGQKAFFGGTKWTTESVQASPEAMAAAQEFYDAILKNRDAFAKQFNAQVGDLVGGTYQAQFDKKGNLTSQSATVLGHEYKDATQEDFGKILTAENMIAVLSQFDDGLSALAEGFRKNVDALTQFANASAMAEAAFQGGANILALGADQTLTSFLELAQGVQGMGETIDQTVQRLLQAQAQYDQFVAQFKPAATYVDDFEASMAAIRDSMKAAMDQANALARAAGAQGAATKDLVNIQQYAAKQMAAAIRQLEAQAQSLAFNLGVSNVGSLDQINSEIERLQAKAEQGAHAVGGFGGAMQSAAQKANDAIQLLIGDLSPLNDMQKLEEARKGLMAGQVSQEQFLQIARRLYASSAQYEREFSFAQQFGSRGAAAVGGGSRGGPSNVGVGLSGEESKRLAELLKQQQLLQQAAQLAQFQTLAQQIAEISSAKGEDYMQVIQDMGIDLKGLEEGLGIANDDALKAYIETRQAQLDSDGENTQSIVEVLTRILDAIEGNGGINGDPSHSGRPSPNGNDQAPFGHAGGRFASDQELADAIGAAVGREVNRYGDRR